MTENPPRENNKHLENKPLIWQFKNTTGSHCNNPRTIMSYDKIEQKRNHHKMKTGARFCAEQSQPELALKTKTRLATDTG
jgi:hypothetical protein